MANEKQDSGVRRDDLRAQLARLGHAARGARPDAAAVRDDVRRALKRRTAPQAVRIGDPEVASGSNVGEPTPILYRRERPRQPVPRRPAASSGRAVGLAEAVPGTECTHPAQGGVFYLVRQPTAAIAGAERLAERFADMLARRDSPVCSAIQRYCDPEPLGPADVIFMDIETTGLSSSPLFLIGVMIWDGNDFVVEQYFARNYAEEGAVVASFLDTCRPRSLLVTFNGKSFDVPFIRARCATTGLRFNLDPVHLDLLHESRRVWRGQLPNCKLQTLEHHICGRLRVDDLPGSEIPDAYHDYVRTQDARLMAEAIKHNQLDLVTLADLMTRFP